MHWSAVRNLVLILVKLVYQGTLSIFTRCNKTDELGTANPRWGPNVNHPSE